MRPDYTEPKSPLHCTMCFDPDSTNEEYATLWSDMLEGKLFDVVTTDIFVGPQGLAAAVQLPNNLKSWYQITNSIPHITLMYPYQKQYPLTPQAQAGIGPTLEGLLEAGVLIPTHSRCNTPIFPVRKPNSDKWRLVHDLRAINHIVEAEAPIVPDPHTLLSNIPGNTKWYTVIDLCSAFFSIPLHPDSQHLFAFTYNGQQYTYTRLPQGYCESPSIFNRIVARDLASLDIDSLLLTYVDDILICSPTKEQCQADSLKVLRLLAENGHKVSKEKLQFCKQEVEYLGRVLHGTSRKLSPTHLEAVRKADQKKAALVWTTEAIAAFEMLKEDLCTAPALASPDYGKPFFLYVSEKRGFTNAVLTQQQGPGKQPVAYFSCRLDNIESGRPMPVPYLRGPYKGPSLEQVERLQESFSVEHPCRFCFAKRSEIQEKETVDSLMEQLEEKLQYEDPEFSNSLVNLTYIADLPDKPTWNCDDNNP
ncbi:uncharacterized protein LOC131349629 [Hemibagrus wyckioides]|uniref:uncharacterized protein LOC131349629 n=1 Tax=Hemibagrus wyckioides TaxID=337641 RepID=UPI00266CDEC4|nr:uncharacterized protein LOC131349629 [Hemibagrus wyckioides]